MKAERIALMIIVLALTAIALVLVYRAMAAPSTIERTMREGDSIRYRWEDFAHIDHFARLTVVYCNSAACLVSIYQETSGAWESYSVGHVMETVSIPGLLYVTPESVYVTSTQGNKSIAERVLLPLLNR